VAVALVDGRLYDGHACGAGSGDLLQLSFIRHGEVEISVGAKIGGGRLGVVLQRIFFADDQIGAVGLKKYHARGDRDGFGVFGRFEYRDFHVAFSRRHRLVEIDSAVDGADEHRLRAKSRIVERELALRV